MSAGNPFPKFTDFVLFTFLKNITLRWRRRYFLSSAMQRPRTDVIRKWVYWDQRTWCDSPQIRKSFTFTTEFLSRKRSTILVRQFWIVYYFTLPRSIFHPTNWQLRQLKDWTLYLSDKNSVFQVQRGVFLFCCQFEAKIFLGLSLDYIERH